MLESKHLMKIVNKLSESEEDIISAYYGINFYVSENTLTSPIQIVKNFYIKCWFIDHNIMLNEFLLDAGENTFQILSRLQ